MSLTHDFGGFISQTVITHTCTMCGAVYNDGNKPEKCSCRIQTNYSTTGDTKDAVHTI